MDTRDTAILLNMAHSPISNYVIPGLTSYLIGNPSDNGTVRLFHCLREHQEAITPHSHRFDFSCRVLRGRVLNRVWTPGDSSNGDLYSSTTLTYDGAIGQYQRAAGESKYWRYTDAHYSSGETYSMRANEVHSIFFGRDTFVLFFEGPTVASTSIALEPVVNGAVIPTLETKPWMFQRAA